MTIDAECGQSFLGVGRKDGGKIDRARTFGAVETPHSLGPVGIHVHCFRTVAPAGSDGDGGSYALALKFVGACGRFGHTAYGGIGNDTLHGCAVGIAKIGGDKIGHCFCQIHGLVFKAFSHSALTSVNGRTNADFRVIFHVVQVIQ